MSDSDNGPQTGNTQAENKDNEPQRKPWTTPAFTLVGDLKDAQTGKGTPTDFKLKGPKMPPGQGS